jgi:hypothetical protein
VLIKPPSWERHGLKPWIEAAKKRLHRNVLGCMGWGRPQQTLLRAAEQLQRVRIRPALIELPYSLLEKGSISIVKGCASKQSQTGPELEVVGASQEFTTQIYLCGASSAVCFDASVLPGSDPQGNARPDLNRERHNVLP